IRLSIYNYPDNTVGSAEATIYVPPVTTPASPCRCTPVVSASTVVDTAAGIAGCPHDATPTVDKFSVTDDLVRTVDAPGANMTTMLFVLRCALHVPTPIDVR